MVLPPPNRVPLPDPFDASFAATRRLATTRRLRGPLASEQHSKRFFQVAICYVPFDPAARNIPLSGKLKFTYGLTWISMALLISNIISNQGFEPLRLNPMWGGSAENLLAAGGLARTAVVDSKQWWRLCWAMFLHAGVFHLVMNLIVWIGIGALLEPDWGAWRLFWVFFAAGLTGNLLSCTLDPVHVSVGTSGGIYGCMVGIVVYVLEYWVSIPNSLTILLIAIGSWLIAIGTSFIPYVDTYAHLGGSVGGLLMALATIRRFGPTEMRKPQPSSAIPAIEFPTKADFRRQRTAADEIEGAQGDDEMLPGISSIISPPREMRHRGYESGNDGGQDPLDLTPPSACRFMIDDDKWMERLQEPNELLIVGDHLEQKPPSQTSQTGYWSQTGLFTLRHRGDPRSRHEAATVGTGDQTQFINMRASMLRPEVVYDSEFSWWKKMLGLQKRQKKTYTHFPFRADRLIINAAAARTTIRRTRDIEVSKDEWDLTSWPLWLARLLAAGLLLAGWIVLFWLNFGCAECYSPPGQIIDIKKLRDAAGYPAHRVLLSVAEPAAAVARRILI